MLHNPTSILTKSFTHSSKVGVNSKHKKQKEARSEGKRIRLSGKKLIIAIVAAATAIAILCGVGAFALLSGEERDYTAISAYISTGGTAYLCHGDGSHLAVNGDIKDAVMTADGKRIVVVDNSANVYWLRTGKDDKNIIAKGADGQVVEIVGVFNDMFFFTAESKNTAGNSEMQLYCHSFEEKFTQMITSLSSCDGVTTSSTFMSRSADEGTVAFASGGTIYVFDHDDMTTVSVGAYNKNDEITMQGVSPDGEAVLWTSRSSNTVVPYLWYEGVTTELDHVAIGETAPSYFLNCPEDSSDVLVVTNSDSGRVYIKADSKKSLVTVDLSAKLVSTSLIYTADGELLNKADDVNEKQGFFIPTVRKNGNTELISMYHVSENGTFNEIASNIKYGSDTFDFSGKSFLYIDSSNVAHIAKLEKNKTAIADTAVITHNALGIFGNDSGADLVYVLTEGKNNAFDLYQYDVKKQSTALVESGVDERILISDDAKTVYYFTDTESTENAGTIGKLNSYSEGKKSTVEEKVLLDSVTSNLASGELDSKAVWFYTYKNATGDKYIFDMVFYNGQQLQVKIANATSK